MFDFLRALFRKTIVRKPAFPPPRFGIAELAERVQISPANLRTVRLSYTRFEIPKRSGGKRTLHAPNPQLKRIQRLILRRVLHGLRAHPSAMGFERKRSIVDNALPHAGADVVIGLDLKDFFPSISTDRVRDYFRYIGFDEETAELLAGLCAHEGRLPQGAPTSPRLSNLVNYRLDVRLAALADARGMKYTRYADDITISWRRTRSASHRRGNSRPNDIIDAARRIIEDEGYRLHLRRKLRIARRHHRQLVTGLVVNLRPNLPRSTRRRLRAVTHHLATGRPATLTAEQLTGWRALQSMISQKELEA